MSPDWNELYETYVKDVYRFLLFLTGSREEAEEIAQDVFLRAFQKLPQIENYSNVKSWLFTVAKNLAVDRLRKRKRQKLLQALIKFDSDRLMPELPDQHVAMVEDMRELYSAIQFLKPNYRAVVIIRGIEQYSLNEAALILNWSESKVKSTYHRALKTLKQQLQAKGVNADGLQQS